MATYFRNDFTADERQVVQYWTRGLAAAYMAVCLLIIGFASQSHPPAPGSGEIVAVHLASAGTADR